MESDAITTKFQYALGRIAVLQQRGATGLGTPTPPVVEVLEELQRTLEELHVAEEEQRSQADQLLAIQAELDDERRRYAALFDDAPDAYLVSDGHGIIRLANARAERLLGASSDLLVGLPLAAFMPAAERREFRERLIGLRATAGSAELSLQLRAHRRRTVEVGARVAVSRARDGAAPELRWLLRVETAAPAGWSVTEARLRAILDAAPDAMIVHDRTGRIVLTNRQFEVLFGYGQSEVSGRNVEMIVPERLREAHVARRAAYAGAPYVRPMGVGLELVGQRKDGSEFPVEVSLGPAEVESELYLISTIRDISERRRLEAERDALEQRERRAYAAETAARRQLEQVQRLTDAALAHIDTETLLADLLLRVREVLDADLAAIYVLERDGNDLIVQATSGIDEEDTIAGTRLPVRGSVAGRILRRSKPLRLDDVTTLRGVRPLLERAGARSLVGARLVSGGKAVGVVYAGRRRVQPFDEAGTDLLQLAADRMALAVDHAYLYAEAMGALRMHDETLAVVTHDLGQPLATVKGFAQLLLRRAAGDPSTPSWLNEGLAGIDEAATAMLAMVDELHDVARLQAGRPLELREADVDLVGLVRQQVAPYREISPRHRFRFEGPERLVGYWDRSRLVRVVSNLLSNAVKYSPEGGEVWVDITDGTEDGRRWAVLRIADDGVGIPAQDLPRVFERFHRGSNVRGRIEGTGIGLAGARQIVEQHGGRITVASREHAGTTVTIRLPLS